jgi:hypothetical protein
MVSAYAPIRAAIAHPLSHHSPSPPTPLTIYLSPESDVIASTATAAISEGSTHTTNQPIEPSIRYPPTCLPIYRLPILILYPTTHPLVPTLT